MTLLRYEPDPADEKLGRENGEDYIARAGQVYRVCGPYMRPERGITEWPCCAVARRIAERKAAAERDRAAVERVGRIERRRGTHNAKRRYEAKRRNTTTEQPR